MLRNYKKPSPAPLVSPDAFVLLYKHRATCEAIYRAEEIQKAWLRMEELHGETDEMWKYMGMIGAIYEAGRIEGIREERRKRRA